MNKYQEFLDEIDAVSEELHILSISPDAVKVELAFERTMTLLDEVRADGISQSDYRLLKELGMASSLIEEELSVYRSSIGSRVAVIESSSKANSTILTALLSALTIALSYVLGRVFGYFFAKGSSSGGGSASPVVSAFESAPPKVLKVDELRKLAGVLNIKGLTNLSNELLFLILSSDQIEGIMEITKDTFEEAASNWEFYSSASFKDVMSRDFDKKLTGKLEKIDKLLAPLFKLGTSAEVPKADALVTDLDPYISGIAELSKVRITTGGLGLNVEPIYAVKQRDVKKAKKTAEDFLKSVEDFNKKQAKEALDMKLLDNSSADNEWAKRYRVQVLLPIKLVRTLEASIIARWFMAIISAKTKLAELTGKLDVLERSLHNQIKRYSDTDVVGKTAYLELADEPDVRIRLTALHKIHDKFNDLNRDADMVKFKAVFPLLKNAGYL